MQDRRSLISAILAATTALLAIAIVGPESVVISYLPLSVMRNRAAWTVSLIVIIVAIVTLAVWQSRQTPPGERCRGYPNVPAVDGWIDRLELDKLVKMLTEPVTGAGAATTAGHRC